MLEKLSNAPHHFNQLTFEGFENLIPEEEKICSETGTPFMATAYDNTKIDLEPVRWNMKEILTITLVLGLAGVISSIIFYK